MPTPHFCKEGSDTHALLDATHWKQPLSIDFCCFFFHIAIQTGSFVVNAFDSPNTV